MENVKSVLCNFSFGALQDWQPTSFFFFCSCFFFIMILINQYKIPDMLGCERPFNYARRLLHGACFSNCSVRSGHSRPGLALTLKRHCLVKLEDGEASPRWRLDCKWIVHETA